MWCLPSTFLTIFYNDHLFKDCQIQYMIYFSVLWKFCSKISIPDLIVNIGDFFSSFWWILFKIKSRINITWEFSMWEFNFVFFVIQLLSACTKCWYGSNYNILYKVSFIILDSFEVRIFLVHVYDLWLAFIWHFSLFS